MLKKIAYTNFTVFEKLEVDFSPGINIFVGENGTGKTHLLKSVYAACGIAKSGDGFAEKINNVFFPSGKHLGRLIKRGPKSTRGEIKIIREVETREAENGRSLSLSLRFSNHTLSPDKAEITGEKAWKAIPMNAAYIPVKDMLANSPGFPSLYQEREIHFEEIYVDIIRKASLPLLKGPVDQQRKGLLEKLQTAMDGKIVLKNEEFFLKNRQGELEFTLLAEGFRKLGLLWLLIQNGTLLNGSALFWDEPEANLNPKLMGAIASILLELQRTGVQIFLATHDYVLLKEFDLQAEPDDNILFHSLFRDKESGEIHLASTSQYLAILPNAIDDTFGIR